MPVSESQRMLKELIEFYGVILDSYLPTNVSGVQLLGAIAFNESSFGKNNVPKYEPSWDKGGKYYDEELGKLYSKRAATSRSSFQIMYPIAVREYGLSRFVIPEQLETDHVAIFYVFKYILKKVEKGADTVEKILDAYNSGTHKDAQSEHVKAYVSRGLKAYYSCRVDYGLKGGRIGT